MTDTLEPKFSCHFDGIVWNMVAVPGQQILLVEVRDHTHKKVSFSALQYDDHTFLWRDVTLEEPWWINLVAAENEIIIFSVYLDTNNPDKKGIYAYGLHDLKLKWWNNDFSLGQVNGDYVYGVTSGIGSKNMVLDLHSGKVVPGAVMPAKKEGLLSLIKPHQYHDGTEYFDTVKTFLSRRLNLLPIMALEYLEYDSQIFISYYHMEEDGLANYLCVLSAAGDVRLHEKTDERLKGIGQDTFFILPGCLLFVKNKQELKSYFL